MNEKANHMQPVRTRKMVVAAMLSAVASVLMMLDFSVPLMPGFIKLDISEFPALLATFSLGPLYGAGVCLVKNVIHLFFTSTGGVGELCNFLLGAAFVVPVGYIYKKHKTRKWAIIGSVLGALFMALASVPINYYIAYPIYAKFLPIDVIVSMYQEIFGGVNGLLDCLLVFNLPFTFVKGLLNTIIVFLVYKRLSPILHGK